MSKKEYLENSPELNEVAEQDAEFGKYLILHNDDVHSFDFVIESLVKVCEMDSIQAEQCTFLVHYKGKCDVKKGTYKSLKPYKEALIEKGLEATID